MKEDIKIKGVKVGDKFKMGHTQTAEVVDILEQVSLSSGEVVSHVCIAKGQGLATNKFEVPFATVMRNKI